MGYIRTGNPRSFRLSEDQVNTIARDMINAPEESILFFSTYFRLSSTTLKRIHCGDHGLLDQDLSRKLKRQRKGHYVEPVEIPAQTETRVEKPNATIQGLDVNDYKDLTNRITQSIEDTCDKQHTFSQPSAGLEGQDENMSDASAKENENNQMEWTLEELLVMLKEKMIKEKVEMISISKDGDVELTQRQRLKF